MKLWWFGLALVMPTMVLAHSTFEEHDHGDEFGTSDTSVSEEVTVPSVDASFQQQYFEALQKAQQRGVVLDQQSLTELLLEQSDQLLEETAAWLPMGAEELPFAPLDYEFDRDRDGLSDLDEQRLGTQAAVADTDGDSFIDGLEIIRGYNPTVPSPTDKVSYQLPDEGLLDFPSPYQITGVRLQQQDGQELLVITGIAPAHSLVLLLVDAGEIKTWFVRADDSGRFLYASADTLRPGRQTIQAAPVSLDGQVKESSTQTIFERTTEGLVMLSPSSESTQEELKALPESVWWQEPPGVFLVGLGVVAPGIALPVWLLLRQRALQRRYVRDSRRLE